MENHYVRNMRYTTGEHATDEHSERKRKRKKRRKIILRSILVVLLLLLVYVLFTWNNVRHFLYNAFVELNTENLRNEELVLGEAPFSVLVLGIDREGPQDRGRSDTIMLITVNPDEQSTYILSIARDTYVYIVGNGSRTRINHAYAYGGPEMAINTIQRFLNVPIDRYVEIDMEGFGPLIDAVGGVTVYNSHVAFSQDGFHFPLGYVRLNGAQALSFVRMRMDDPLGDYGRQYRQRLVTGAVMSEMGVTTVMNPTGVIGSITDYFQSSFTMGDMTTVALNYAGAVGRIEHLQLQGFGQNINGMALQVVPEYHLTEMSTRLRRHLELE